MVQDRSTTCPVPSATRPTRSFAWMAMIGAGVRRTTLVVGLAWVGLLAGAAGALAQVPGSPVPTGGISTASVAFSPSGGFLATANSGTSSTVKGNTVSVFKVEADDTLRLVTSKPVGTAPSSVAFSSNGLLATANTMSNNVSVFSVAPDGALTPVPPSPYTVGNSPTSVAFSPSGGLLATANSAGRSVSVFSVAAD